MASVCFRDRTHEFALIVKQASSRVPIPQAHHRQNFHQKSDFNARAGAIGKEVHRVANELAKLTKLAKRISTFDVEDSTEEIAELTVMIKEDIDNLNKDLESLAQIQKAERQANAQSGKHAESVVGVLKTNLMKTTQDFKTVLQLRTENMKTVQDRRSLFAASSAFATKRADPSYYQANIPRRRSPTPHESDNNDVVLELGEARETQALLVDQYSENRAEAMQNIEEIIGDLGRIFQQLATMVSQQQEQIQRIDSNVEESLHHVEDGHAQLLKYMKDISSNRPLIFKTFLAILLTMILFIIFS